MFTIRHAWIWNRRSQLHAVAAKLTEVEIVQPYPAPRDSKLHARVLNTLGKLVLPGYGVLVEQRKSRLDLPNEYFRENRKSLNQRKRSLSYIDAVVHVDRTIRVLIEVVDKSPSGPNGITGLTVNADRIAEVHTNIDLVFIVLAQMKNFYCEACGSGHKISNTGKLRCLALWLQDHPEDGHTQLFQEGKAAAFRKALLDYPISKYLHNIRPPSVIFLNLTKVRTAWDTYETHALQLIQGTLQGIISQNGNRQSLFRGVHELLPELPFAEEKDARDVSRPPSPGSRVVWNSPSGQIDGTVKNRGSHNTRIRLSDGRTQKVPNHELEW